MSDTAKTLSLVAAAAAAALLAAAPAPAAPGTKTTTTSAATTAPMGATGKKCWSDLIKDWYDGRIDRTYPVHCYRDALKHLPTDVRSYSDAYDVISRALADVTRSKKRVTANTPVPPPGDSGSPPSSGGTDSGGSSSGPKTPPPAGGTGTGPAPPGPSPRGGTAAGGPIGGVLNTGDQGASGVPIPLIVLGAVAFLLVAAGAAGLVTRRLQARRGRP